MSTSGSLAIGIFGIFIGIFIGVGGVYSEIIPDFPAQVREIRLQGAHQIELQLLNDEIQDKEKVIEDLNTEHLMLNSSLLEMTTERESFLVLSSQLQENLETVEARLADAANQVVVSNLLVEQMTALRESLQGEIVVLDQDISNLNQQIALQTAQNNALQSRIDSLTVEFNAIRMELLQAEARWNAWKAHSNLAPRANDEIEFLGAQGDTLLISFSNPGTCLRLGRLSGSGSMQPAMGAGHMALATTCFDNEDLQPGDIIVYRENANLIIHQIIEIRAGEGVITKGINNAIPDPLVPWEAIESLVVAIVY